MKIAVLSDSHDHLDHVGAVLAAVAGEKAERMFFLGDFCAPFTLTALAEGFSGPIDCVSGNNDGDHLHLSKIAAQHPQVTLHGQLAELEADGRKIGLNHYPDIARRLAESQAYDAVFSGHDHRRYIHQTGRTLWANPGEIMGRYKVVSFGIYETESNSFRHVIVRE
ncbi:MAG TPA: YfcE family phosphodiesterase [Verrucomicrobiales bacterium]|jgi:putative phosphoesterase|nr:YfcE family phosphodiesterase [Verrucomicrobiales bacterium]